MASVILAALVVAIAAVLLWQNRHRLPTRGHQTPVDESYEECEVCGARGPQNVTLGAVTPRPEMGGSSGITATFCPEHLPAEHRGR